jgi:hypothetical protein
MGGWLLAIPSFERHEKYRKFLAKLFFLFFLLRHITVMKNLLKYNKKREHDKSNLFI